MNITIGNPQKKNKELIDKINNSKINLFYILALSTQIGILLLLHTSLRF